MTLYLAAAIQNNAMMRNSAIMVLQAYNIREPPINVYDILKDQEVGIDFWEFSNPKIEGMYIRDFSGPGIAINSNHPTAKQRFTAGHELKHHLHDIPDDGSGLPPCMSDNRTHIERKANTFAAELLMPVTMFQAVLQELGNELTTVTTLAASFRVSYEATVYRLNNLGFINEGQTCKLLTPDSRREDALCAAQGRQNGHTDKIRTPALLAALNHLDGVNLCSRCKAVILNDHWELCPDCCTRLN